MPAQNKENSMLAFLYKTLMPEKKQTLKWCVLKENCELCRDVRQKPDVIEWQGNVVGNIEWVLVRSKDA